MALPVVFAHLTNGRCIVAVNLATAEMLELLRHSQIGGVPCDNPKCQGGPDGWDTSVIGWLHETRAPQIFIDKDGTLLPSPLLYPLLSCGGPLPLPLPPAGAPNPMTATKMKCNTCKTRPSYLCTHPIVLQRLPPHVRNALPWDYNWRFQDVFLDSVWTDNFEYDAIKRQGATNCAEKIMIRGAKTSAKLNVSARPLPPSVLPAMPRLRSNAPLTVQAAYYMQGQLWWKGLNEMVGDAVWKMLSTEQQMQRQFERVELLFHELRDDKVAWMSDRTWKGRFGEPHVTTHVRQSGDVRDET